MSGKVIFVFFLIKLLFPSYLSAQVVINEISPASNPEWVELYNLTDNQIDLSGWSLKDAAQPPQFLTGNIGPRNYFVFEKSQGWLNNSGDELFLFNNSSPSAQIDHVSFGSHTSISAPSPEQSIGRTPDGSSNWTSSLAWSKLAANPQSISPIPQIHTTPSITQPVSPSLTSTSTPKPTAISSRKPTPASQLPTSLPSLSPASLPSPVVAGVSTSHSPRSLPPLLPLILIGLGTILLLISFFWVYKDIHSRDEVK